MIQVIVLVYEVNAVVPRQLPANVCQTVFSLVQFVDGRPNFGLVITGLLKIHTFIVGPDLVNHLIVQGGGPPKRAVVLLQDADSASPGRYLLPKVYVHLVHLWIQ